MEIAISILYVLYRGHTNRTISRSAIQFLVFDQLLGLFRFKENKKAAQNEPLLVGTTGFEPVPPQAGHPMQVHCQKEKSSP
jgi:hypothetical protein